MESYLAQTSEIEYNLPTNKKAALEGIGSTRQSLRHSERNVSTMASKNHTPKSKRSKVSVEESWLQATIESAEYTYEFNKPTEEEKETALQHRRKLTLRNQRIYKKKHPERVRARSLNRSILKQGGAKLNSEKLGNHLSILLTTQNGKCWWCGDNLGDDYQIDHVIPLSRGGSNNPNNLVASCPSCNHSKSDKLPHEWIGRLF